MDIGRCRIRENQVDRRDQRTRVQRIGGIPSHPVQQGECVGVVGVPQGSGEIPQGCPERRSLHPQPQLQPVVGELEVGEVERTGQPHARAVGNRQVEPSPPHPNALQGAGESVALPEFQRIGQLEDRRRQIRGRTGNSTRKIGPAAGSNQGIRRAHRQRLTDLRRRLVIAVSRLADLQGRLPRPADRHLARRRNRRHPANGGGVTQRSRGQFREHQRVRVSPESLGIRRRQIDHVGRLINHQTHRVGHRRDIVGGVRGPEHCGQGVGSGIQPRSVGGTVSKAARHTRGGIQLVGRKQRPIRDCCRVGPRDARRGRPHAQALGP